MEHDTRSPKPIDAADLKGTEKRRSGRDAARDVRLATGIQSVAFRYLRTEQCPLSSPSLRSDAGSAFERALRTLREPDILVACITCKFENDSGMENSGLGVAVGAASGNW